MPSAREEILKRLRERQHPEPLPPAWTRSREFPDLEARFVAALQAAKGEAVRAADFEDALARLEHILREVAARRVVVNPDPPLDTVQWHSRWPAIEWFVVGQTSGDLRAFCAEADVGISSAVAALAETGSIIVASGPNHSRMATLLPPVHVALIPTSRLMADLFAWVQQRPAPMPANVTIISGPSKSADIEQTLAVGVHGPQRFVVVLYPDA